MNKSVFKSAKQGLSRRLADLELPITVKYGHDQHQYAGLASNLYTFGAVAKFLSTPFADEEISVAEYSKLNVAAKRKREKYAGHWLPGRWQSCENGVTTFMQSYFVFDAVGWKRDDFEEFIRTSVTPGGIAMVVHSLRGHTKDKPKARMIFPLFEPIPLSDAYLAQPEVPELLCHLELSGRVVGECLSDVDRPLELPSVSYDEDYLFHAVDGAPIFADSILEMLNDGCLLP